MSFRLLALPLALLAVLAAAAGCGGHAGRQAASRAAPTLREADVRRGATVFAAQCQACHGPQGAGGPVGPSLHNENVRRPYRAVYRLVRDPSPPMPKLYPSRLSARDLRDVSAYVETL